MALDEVCTTLPTPASRAASSMLAVPVTFTDSNRSLSLASGTWATLWKTTSTPSKAPRTAVRVADVRLDELDLGTARELVGWVQVEDAHLVAAGVERLAGEHGPEIAAAAGDEDVRSHQSCSPRSMHQRMLARIPSSSATFGS